MTPVVCTRCFSDQGLQLEAARFGVDDTSACPKCGSHDGSKLDAERAKQLAHSFFVRGTVARLEYGAAPLVQFDEHQATSIRTAPWLRADLELLGSVAGVGFFHYGPGSGWSARSNP